MSWEKLLGELGKAMSEADWSEMPDTAAPGDPGEGEFAEMLAGTTLRQFIRGSLGGSTEKLLKLDADGRFAYREVAQYDGGFVHGDPEFGTWTASGDFPAGELALNWYASAPSRHVLEYQGGDTCRLDGTPTQIL